MSWIHDIPLIKWNVECIWMESFRLSIGDVSAPKYTFWENNLEDSPFTSYFMICLIWIVWLLEIFFVLIVLLNFLIAIISQSYEEVMLKSLQNKYHHRAQLNRECRMTLSLLRLDRSLSPFVMATNLSGELEGEWQGLIHQVKKYLHDETSVVKEKLQNVEDKMI